MKSLHIQFSNINVSAISGNSGIFTGSNYQYNWTVNKKSNAGFGKMIGYDNLSMQNANIVHDNDVMDSDFSQTEGTINQPTTQS
ncbi:hypothetical protein CEF21_07595 [Bacillus sp. FJAT-42376]|uniref:hypothetical protein n=1 Tax=Bacillus sp. FJAT-42376 TaxID=2014076 RepID=UPI000F5140FC|nr:hypothetical protein [Bacillus sp. FJAT-42376]AZB42163.1 hypothetical protein CEF21_07595 [Bacillus sp. FJAT-42376]